VYSSRGNFDLFIKELALSLKSAKLATNYLPLFDVEDISQLKELFEEMEKKHKAKDYIFGYTSSFDEIPLIANYLKASEIATIK
jgi:hypothetical protein